MKQTKVKVNDIEYTLQNPGYRWYIKHTGIANKGGSMDQEYLMDKYFETVVVEPKVSMEDFEEKDELGGFKAMLELISECEKFLTT